MCREWSPVDANSEHSTRRCFLSLTAPNEQPDSADRGALAVPGHEVGSGLGIVNGENLRA